MPNFNDLSEIFSIADQVIMMYKINNQEMYSHPIQQTQISQQIILPLLETKITCVPTTIKTPQELIDRQQ